MKTSPTDAPGALFVEYDGGGRRLLRGGVVDDQYDLSAEPVIEGVRTVLVVPGDKVAIHWLDLAQGLAPAQAAAAARLMLADASAGPLADMHVAVGRPEQGLTPVALAPAALMAEWTRSEPDMIIPSPLLLLPPAEGFVRYDGGVVPDYRGRAAAFSVEPELGALLVGDAPVALVDDATFEAGLGEALAAPVLNLRQGAFAKRRQWRVDKGGVRRAALLGLALIALTLIVQVATILRYAFAADRLEAEAAALGAGGAPGGAARLRRRRRPAVRSGARHAQCRADPDRLSARRQPGGDGAGRQPRHPGGVSPAGRGERACRRGRRPGERRRPADRRAGAEAGMSESLALWWGARSARERRLLLVMLALAALVLGWLAVVRPLADALDAPKARHGAAVVALARGAGARRGRPAARAPGAADAAGRRPGRPVRRRGRLRRRPDREPGAGPRRRRHRRRPPAGAVRLDRPARAGAAWWSSGCGRRPMPTARLSAELAVRAGGR